MTVQQIFDHVVARIRAMAHKERPAAKDAAQKLALRHRLSACNQSVFQAVLLRIKWDTGIVFPGYKCLQADTGFSRRSVASSVRRLRDARLFLTDPRRGKDGRSSNHYTVPGLIGLDPAALVQMLALAPGKDTPRELVQPSAPHLVQTHAPEPLTPTIEIEPGSARTDRQTNGEQQRTQIPPNWALSPGDRRYTLERYEITNVELDRECEGFVAYHNSKATLLADWSAGWQRWISNKGFPYSRRTQTVSQALGEREWDNALGLYVKRPDLWPTASYGPEPGRNGCRAPPVLLRKHGLPESPFTASSYDDRQ